MGPVPPSLAGCRFAFVVIKRDTTLTCTKALVDKRAESMNYRLESGTVLNGREYVDLCIAEGFSKICHVPTGSARRYYIQDPGRQAVRPLRAKDGTLAYAQARLAGSAVDVTVAA